MEPERIDTILRKCELFAELSEAQVDTIAALGSIEEFNGGEAIYAQGAVGRKVYVLAGGQVSLTRSFDLGARRTGNVAVYVLKERSNRRLMGGWSSLVGEAHVQMCSALCDKPTRVVSLPCAELRQAIVRDPVLGVKVLEKLILILRDRIEGSYAVMEML